MAHVSQLDSPSSSVKDVIMDQCIVSFHPPFKHPHLFQAAPRLPTGLANNDQMWGIDSVRRVVRAVRMASRSFKGRRENNRPPGREPSQNLTVRLWLRLPRSRCQAERLIFEREQCLKCIDARSIISSNLACMRPQMCLCVSVCV